MWANSIHCESRIFILPVKNVGNHSAIALLIIRRNSILPIWTYLYCMMAARTMKTMLATANLDKVTEALPLVPPELQSSEMLQREVPSQVLPLPHALSLTVVKEAMTFPAQPLHLLFRHSIIVEM